MSAKEPPKPPVNLSLILKSSFSKEIIESSSESRVSASSPVIKQILVTQNDVIKSDTSIVSTEKIEVITSKYDGYCEAILQSGVRCRNKSKNKRIGLCGTHIGKNIQRVDLSKPHEYANTPHPDEDDHCKKIRDFAFDKLSEHGLHAWRFEWDMASRRFGQCVYKTKRITVSMKLAKLNNWDQCQDTVLHEIAHALAPKDHHGEVWKSMCIKIGARPERCYNSEEVAKPDSKYVLECPKCGKVKPCFRKTKKMTENPSACGSCCRKYNEGKWHKDFAFTVKENN